MNASALSIIPTASWSVGAQAYQPDFVTVAAPGSESSEFTTAAAPKVGGVGAWVAPAVLGTSLLGLGGCERTEKTQMPDGSVVTKRDDDPMITGAVFLVACVIVSYSIVNKLI